jgi:hypothetical protein
MGSKNLYIKDTDMEVFEKMEKLLDQEGKSLSEFVAESTRNFVERHEKTEKIELDSGSRKRVFTGYTLFWNDDSGSELGVFHTAKGQFVYWYFPGDGTREIFRIHPSLADLFEQENLADETRAEVEDAYAELQGLGPTVEELDI